jgi:hypothetical protein
MNNSYKVLISSAGLILIDVKHVWKLSFIVFGNSFYSVPFVRVMQVLFTFDKARYREFNRLFYLTELCFSTGSFESTSTFSTSNLTKLLSSNNSLTLLGQLRNSNIEYVIKHPKKPANIMPSCTL